MSSSEANSHLEEAKGFYRKAVAEFQRARDEKDEIALRDACAKGWLAAIEATHALLLSEGIKEEELPKTNRARKSMIGRIPERELRWLYFSLRDNLHIEGYYNGSLDFDEAQTHLSDLELYIQRVERRISGCPR